MRYAKLGLIALVLLWLVFELIINIEGLNHIIFLSVGLPLCGVEVIPVRIWEALLMGFVLAFLVAVALEVGAWYEYSRTIRLQRKQIRALQNALDLKRRSKKD